MKLECCLPEEDLLPVLEGEATADMRIHVEDCPACRLRLDELRADLAVIRSVCRTGQDASQASPVRPALIGKYLIVGCLDTGGQARVYRALHPTLDKELVIKISRRPVGELTDSRHFLIAEGKLLARLDHPNLARVYDLDFHEDVPFLAMEYVRGSDLKRFAEETSLSPRQAAALVAETARALAVVHRHGIVHQDVKPKNILVDADGRPRLIDFGLARLRHAWDDGPTEPSGGTPAYMAPEQARGETAAVGPRSDLFGLGGVLYFLLTGQAPFTADNAAAAEERARRCDFDRTALRRAGVPRRLEAICLKAMAERPEDRYGRAEEFAEELERFVRRPHVIRRVLLAAAAILLVGAVGLWFATRPAATPVLPAAPNAPELLIQVARGDAYLDLRSALPLKTETDRVQIVAKVPAGFEGVLFHVDTRGKVKQLAAHASPADAFTRLVFPGEGGQAPFDPGTSGTEFVLLCAAPTPEDLDGLDDLVGSLIPALPKLPLKVTVWLNRDEPQRQSSPFGLAKADPVAQVEAKLDLLRQRLRQKRIPVMVGVAFAH